MSKFEGHGWRLVDNRPRMPKHADDSPTGSENLAQVVESEQATRFEAALEALAANTRRVYGSALAARRLSQDSYRLPLLFGELLILQESGRAVTYPVADVASGQPGPILCRTIVWP